ncbi:hypothetical protein J6590_087247 [Homalodisca vitripennis]|nr:hypothetical protein J6590_087247 [Homalodisca vitripennis]
MTVGVSVASLDMTKCCALPNLTGEADCVNLSSKELKDLSKKDSTNWMCKKCSSSQICSPKTQLPVQMEINSSNSSIQELEQSIMELNPENTEDNLLAAAKIGSALLDENNFFKSQNTKLSSKLTNMEAKIEELENCEEKYMFAMEKLQEKNAELESQGIRDKENLLKVQSIFEDHDRKQAELLNKYEFKINELDKEIINLKRKLSNRQNLRYKEEKLMKNAESQTEHNTNSINSTLPLFSTEIGFLRKNQNLFEEKLKILEAEVKNLADKEDKTLVKNSGKTRNSTPCRTPLKKPFRGTNNAKKIQNKFSISLQVQKMKASKPNPTIYTTMYDTSISTQQSSETNKESMPLISNNTNKIDKLPPTSAKLRDKNESIEEFFNKNLASKITSNQNQPGKTRQDPTIKLSTNATTGRIRQTPSKKLHNQSQTPTEELSNTTEYDNYDSDSSNIAGSPFLSPNKLVNVHPNSHFLEENHQKKKSCKTKIFWNKILV